MITYLLQASTCLVIFYSIYHFILSELTYFKYNRAYLLLSIMASLMIPVIAPLIVLAEETVPVFHWSYIGETTYLVTDNDNEVFDWKGKAVLIFWSIYLIGVLTVLTKMFYGLSRIYVYYLQGQKEHFNGYSIVTTESVHLPFSFFRTIYISRNVPLQEHVQTILEHEKIHIRQWHTLDVLLAESVQAFFWFNPIMIYYKYALRQAHEYLADNLICRNNSVSNYTELLLGKSQTGVELALANQFFQSQLKDRIIMLTKKPSSAQSIWKFALAIPVVLLVMYAFATPEYGESDNTLSIINADTIPHPPSPPAVPAAPAFPTNITEPPSPPLPPPVSSSLPANMAEPLSPPSPPKVPHANQIPIPPKDKSADFLTSLGNTQQERPLVVINGVMKDKSFNLHDIDPNDIESVFVLKNENAVGKYGSKAQSGVIEINTKTESKSKDSGIKNLNKGKQQEQEIFKVVENMPRFPGCENLEVNERDICSKNKMMEYITQNLKYPEEAKKASIEGTCILSFVITKYGDITDIKLLRDIGYGCGTEAERVILSMQNMKEKWVPGTQKGETVAVSYTIPIMFKLNN